jgi:hypothetical protein
MRPIPKSRIIENQYTNGTGIGNNITLRFPTTKIPYVGFYTIINGVKYYSGKLYTENSKLLEQYAIPINPSTIVSNGSVPLNTINQKEGIRYFYKDLTSSNILIKEIDRKAYNQLTNKFTNTYQVLSYNSNIQTLEDVNEQMPGLTTFLGT